MSYPIFIPDDEVLTLTPRYIKTKELLHYPKVDYNKVEGGYRLKTATTEQIDSYKNEFSVSPSPPLIQRNNNKDIYRETVTNPNLASERNETVTRARVMEWIEGHPPGSRLDRRDIRADFGIRGDTATTNLRMILRRLDGDLIVIDRNNTNYFRRVDHNLKVFDFKRVNPELSDFDLELPFDLHKKVRLQKGDYMGLSGVTSAGKSTFLLHLIYLNHLNKKLPPIYYITNELRDVEVADRLDTFEEYCSIKRDEWNFVAAHLDIREEQQFEDVIQPDCINICDYLSKADDWHRVGADIERMIDKVGHGLLIVSIQMSDIRDLPHGGSFPVQSARLYLTMKMNRDNGIGTLKILKAKKPVKGAGRIEGCSATYRFDPPEDPRFKIIQGF